MNERANTTPGQDPEEQMTQEAQEMDTGNQPAPVEEGRESESFPDESDPEELEEDLEAAPAGEPTD